MKIKNWIKDVVIKPDPIIAQLEGQLKEAQEMVEWHLKKMTHHQELVEKYTQLIERVKNI